MYGSKWPFLLMYGSHDMRHTSFLRVDGGQRDPRDLGSHTLNIRNMQQNKTFIFNYFLENVFVTPRVTLMHAHRVALYSGACRTYSWPCCARCARSWLAILAGSRRNFPGT